MYCCWLSHCPVFITSSTPGPQNGSVIANTTRGGLQAMALEWEKDGADGRAVRSPLKFKIGVPQLDFTTSVFFWMQKNAQIWGSIPYISLTGLLRLLECPSLKAWSLGLGTGSHWSLMTQLLSWRHTWQVPVLVIGSWFVSYAFMFPIAQDRCMVNWDRPEEHRPHSSNPSWSSFWNNIVFYVAHCFAVVWRQIYLNISWSIIGCLVRFMILILNATTTSWKRLSLGLATSFTKETQF